MRALITSSRNTFALDMIRKLGSRGHTVVAADTFREAIGNHSKYLAGYEVTASPRYETDQFIADINEIVAKHEIDTIIPTFEEAFYLSARKADLPEGVRLFTGDFDKLARLHDKASFKRLIVEAGVPIPETIVATDHESLVAATEKYPKYFARAAFSRGGVGLLTNTGVLADKLSVDDVQPTAEQPWLVQPFVDGPMVCSYSIVIDGKVTAHSTYCAPEQWAHSTGVTFLSIDSTETLEYTQKIVDVLDPNFTGQLSFDYINHEDTLYAVECNPRPTNGVIVMESDEFEKGLLGEAEETIVVDPGAERQIRLAVLADAFTKPVKHLKHSLHDLLRVKDIGSGWHDSKAMMWGPAMMIHAAKLSKGDHKELLGALGDDIVWNGEPIKGMTDADAAALEAVHSQRG